MKRVIPFYKEIVFKTNIATILNISLEHEEKVLDGEISGNFILMGEYKVHNDTTEIENFKYRLPFTALISDDMNKDTINIDIERFSYEQIEDDVLRIDIDFSIEYELNSTEDTEDEIDTLEDEFAKIDREIDEILGMNKKEEINTFEIEDVGSDDMVVPLILEDNEEKLEFPEVTQDTSVTEKVSKEEYVHAKETEEYVTYHIYVVKENDTLEQILKTYNVSLEYLKEYNEIKDIKIGDKIIIPLYDE